MSERVSVIVCTLDEGEVLERLIEPLGFADEILILDSGSRDGTRETAKELGAVVHEQEWLGFSAQKNRAAELAANDWVLSLDADEIVTPELAAAIEEAMADDPDPRDGFVVDRRGEFLARVLPNGSRRSKRMDFVRLYNRRHSKWDESAEVHEEVVCPGERHMLDGLLLHWNLFTIDELMERYLKYSTIEARSAYDSGKRTNALQVVARPVLRFLWNYVARGEFRLGGHGLVHSGTRAASDFMRLAKQWELQQERELGPKRPRGTSSPQSESPR